MSTPLLEPHRLHSLVRNSYVEDAHLASEMRLAVLIATVAGAAALSASSAADSHIHVCHIEGLPSFTLHSRSC